MRATTDIGLAINYYSSFNHYGYFTFSFAFAFTFGWCYRYTADKEESS
jgi:hypothetical protein